MKKERSEEEVLAEVSEKLRLALAALGEIGKVGGDMGRIAKHVNWALKETQDLGAEVERLVKKTGEKRLKSLGKGTQ